MSRHLVSRSTRPGIYPGAFRLPIAPRKLTTTPPPSSQGQPGTAQKPPAHPEGSNTLIILSALGALGGLYYYYTRGNPAVDRETARRKEEELERKVREMGDVGKSKVEGVAKQGRQDYDQAKTNLQDASSAARARATEAGTDLAERAHSKFDELRNTAERKMSDARDRSEKKIEENKDEVARQARETEHKARGWFGWGSSK